MSFIFGGYCMKREASFKFSIHVGLAILKDVDTLACQQNMYQSQVKSNLQQSQWKAHQITEYSECCSLRLLWWHTTCHIKYIVPG